MSSLPDSITSLYDTVVWGKIKGERGRCGAASRAGTQVRRMAGRRQFRGCRSQLLIHHPGSMGSTSLYMYMRMGTGRERR